VLPGLSPHEVPAPEIAEKRIQTRQKRAQAENHVLDVAVIWKVTWDPGRVVKETRQCDTAMGAGGMTAACLRRRMCGYSVSSSPMDERRPVETGGAAAPPGIADCGQMHRTRGPRRSPPDPRSDPWAPMAEERNQNPQPLRWFEAAEAHFSMRSSPQPL
jgi:hypothetical protein